MARLYGIKQRLPQYGIDEGQIKEIVGNGDLVHVIKRMEQSLAPDVVHRVLDTCACGGGKEYLNKCAKIGEELAGKSFDEKIRHINDISPVSERIARGDGNTLAATLQFADDGKYKCVCSAAVKKGVKVSDLSSDAPSLGGVTMPLTYCFCCAGSYRRHLQLQLGVELRTKEIVSSPINSKGEKPCAFVYEVIE